MPSARDVSVTRRQVLGATAAASLGVTSGCVQRVRSIMNRDSAETVSLTVTAPPADSDRMATLIARHLVSNLEAVGINATLDVLPETELRTQVLLNRDFQLFVARMPGLADPQEYHSLLYGPFMGEPGMQNPYGFTNMHIDDLLGRQRRTVGEQRKEAVADLLEELTRTQPFTIVGFPDEIRAVRSEKYVGWGRHGIRDPYSLLAIERNPDLSRQQTLTLELAMTDSRLSQNLNPISVEYRQTESFTSLLYDPLARRIDGDLVPWLGSEWSLETQGNRQELRVSLRPGQHWHDGTPLTADDVAFSYRFLKDTSLDTLEHTVPAPRFRDRTALVTSATALDDRTVRITVEDASPEVARQILTVPLFPEHVWREETEAADISGFGGSENVTDALVTSNIEPVGSGPVSLTDATADESVTFEPFEDHFLTRASRYLEAVPERFASGVPFDELVFEIVPSNETAVELVVQGDLDGTATAVDPREPIVRRIGEAPGVSMLVEHSRSPYLIGYNTAIQPFSNPYFRRLVARLVDKEHVASTVFEGYGTAASTHFDGRAWTPPELAFDGVDPEVPFLGTDGTVDVERAKAAFRDHGYEYDDETLILR